MALQRYALCAACCADLSRASFNDGGNHAISVTKAGALRRSISAFPIPNSIGPMLHAPCHWPVKNAVYRDPEEADRMLTI